jgi:tetratricopeptide (TPR) repeat protein
MDPGMEIEKKWNLAASAMASGDYDKAARQYAVVLELLHSLEKTAPPGIPPEWTRQNLANGYCDYAHCLLETTRDQHVNKPVRAYLNAVRYGNREKATTNNLLHCMRRVNLFLAARIQPLEDTDRNRELMRWQNAGYHHLKTPVPPGTPGRNWGDAVRCYQEAIRIAPKNAPSYHGLGLACEGTQRLDDAAIDAWVMTQELDPDYDFTTRIKYEIAGAKP